MGKKKKTVDISEYPKTFDLADGTKVQIRPMRPDDLDRLFAFFRSLPQRPRRYFKHDVTQREVIVNWCAHLDYEKVLPLLATVDENGHQRVVADGTLHTERHGWSTHVAEVRLVLASKFRKKGLGRLLLRELYNRAINRGVEKIQAHIRDDDTTSIALLKRLGFKKEAVFRRHAVDTRGAKHDVLVLYNDLSELWSKMEDLNLDFHVVP